MKESDKIWQSINRLIDKVERQIDIEKLKDNLRLAGEKYVKECRNMRPDLNYIGSGGTLSIYAAQKLKDAMNDFNSQNNTKMNKQIIEQIEKIKGVKTVEPMLDRVVVTFEPKKVAVHCINREQLVFAYEKNVKVAFVRKDEKGYVYVGGTWDTEKDFVISRGYTIIPFTQYLTDYNLAGEWEKYLIGEAEKRGFFKFRHKVENISSLRPACTSLYWNPNWTEKSGALVDGETGNVIYRDYIGKWAEIIPNEVELVDGEIYYWDDRIIRFKSKNDKNELCLYSQKLDDGGFFLHSNGVGYADEFKTCKPATPKQKQKLIRAEVKNGYFHELRSKDS